MYPAIMDYMRNTRIAGWLGENYGCTIFPPIIGAGTPVVFG
jgi:hypothetical protein